MTRPQRAPVRFALLLATFATLGLIGLFVGTGTVKIVAFAGACVPLALGLRAYLLHGRRRIALRRSRDR